MSYPDKAHQIGHMPISLGDGYVLEARGRAYSVTIGPVRVSLSLAEKAREVYETAWARPGR